MTDHDPATITPHRMVVYTTAAGVGRAAWVRAVLGAGRLALLVIARVEEPEAHSLYHDDVAYSADGALGTWRFFQDDWE